MSSLMNSQDVDLHKSSSDLIVFDRFMTCHMCRDPSDSLDKL